jgi:hypothetical protein
LKLEILDNIRKIEMKSGMVCETPESPPAYDNEGTYRMH